MPDREIAFFGLLFSGLWATIVVVLLDIASPLLFVFTMWQKIRWGATFGLIYNGIFMLNCLVALFTFKEKLGDAIYFPLIMSIIFFSIILKERKYFS